jgi:hypothetical protein
LVPSAFGEQWEGFVATATNDPEVFDFCGFCLQESSFNWLSGRGLAAVFSALGEKSSGLYYHCVDQVYDDLFAGSMVFSALI